MKASPILLAGASVLLQGQQVHASPISSLPNLVARQATVAVKIIKFFISLGESGAEAAWDIEEHPQMCKISMETRDGSNCKAIVTCDDGAREYNANGQPWNVCFVGGRQFFNDPRIGDFSITFRERDGKGQGEGLTTPILQLKYVGDWQEFPVNDLAEMTEKHNRCVEAGFFLGGCNEGPLICQHRDFGNSNFDKSRFKKWECGVPKIAQSGTGLKSIVPVNEKGYAPGWCGVHVIQYQKPDPSKDSYSLEVTAINDINESKIGSVGKSGPNVSVASKLPLTLEIKTGAVDTDPVHFAYGGQSWDSNESGRCGVGEYDNGKREMDCGFACD